MTVNANTSAPDVDSFLAVFGASLPRASEMQHAVAIDPTAPAKQSGRAFDESKVKRDGGGRFARIAARRPDDDIRTPEQIDAKWKSNIHTNQALGQALWGPKSNLSEKVDAKFAEIKQRTGIDLQKAETLSDTPKVLKAATEFMTYLANEQNKILSTSKAAVSPSGTQRVQIRVINPGTPKVDWKYVYVPNKLQHSTIDVKYFLHELDVQEGSTFGGWSQILKLVEGSLAHFGVKGMKWGVRNGSAGSPKTSKPNLVSDLKVLSGNKGEVSKRRAGATNTNKANVKEQAADQKRDAARRSNATKEVPSREAAMVIGKEVTRAAVKYGLPAGAVALGVGVPLAATLGVSIKVLDDPNVKEALAPVGSAVKSMTSSMGSIKMSDLPKVPDPTASVRKWYKDQAEMAAEAKRSIARSEAVAKEAEAGRAAFKKSVQDAIATNEKYQSEIDALESRIAELDREEARLTR